MTRRWALTALSFLLAVAVSILVIRWGWPAEGAPLGLPRWAHAFALGAVVLDLVARTFKIQLSGIAAHLPLSFGTSLRTSLAGDFAAAITPSRSGAEPARFLVMKEAGLPIAGILVVLFVELFLELVSLIVVAIGLALFLGHTASTLAALTAIIVGYAAFVLGGGAFALALSRHPARGPAPAWARAIGVNARVWRRVQRSLRQLRASVDALRRARRGMLVAALCCSIVHVLARLTILPIIVYAYGAEDVPLARLTVWPLALLYGTAVAPAPAGGGVVELGFKAALGGSIPIRLMAASLIWWRVYSFYAYTVLGALGAGRTAMRALLGREGKREREDARASGDAESDDGLALAPE